MNQVNLIGRITKDLELRTTSTGKSVCEFTIAINRTGSDGADFINCTVWNNQAENLCKYQGKGSQIAVSGSLRQDVYQNSEGENRYKTYVLANYIEYLSSKSSEEVSDQETFDEFSGDIQILDDDDELPF